MKTTESYIIGKGYAPEWCRRFIQPYRKLDGTTGYEYYGKFQNICLKAGDEIIRNKNGFITFKEGKGKIEG